MKSALRSKNALKPPLYGLRKGHKPIPPGQEEIGPPQRPVCGASESSNGPLGEILSDVLNKLGDELEEEQRVLAYNTEEVIVEFEKVNEKSKRGEVDKLVAFSMDVEKLYPSLEVEHVARLVRDTFNTAKLEVETNDVELGLYIAVTRSRKEVEALGLGEVVQKRLKSHGPKPGITTPEILQRGKAWTTVKGRGEREDEEEDSDGDEDGGEKEQDVQTEGKFAPPKRTPMTRERRKMVSLALEAAVLAVMNGHLYSYDNKVRK